MKPRHLLPLIAALALGAVETPSSAQTGMEPWLTRSADNSRSGWNPHERQLSQASVAAKGLTRATIIPVIGDARGMEAQPLILPNVKTALGTRDVMVLPSMADVVRGVDAHDGSGIWQVTLGVPVTGSKTVDTAKGPKSIDLHKINQFWGCLSTGVIDPDTQRLYQVCWVSPDNSGDPKNAQYFMFVLNMADGSQVVPPVQIEGQNFEKGIRKQRSSLVETNVDGVKTVLGCSGTIFETQAGVASGYCFAFDVATNKVSAMLALSAAEGAGVWMAGQGAAADPQGFLYVTTGNGDFDGTSQWGESFLKLKYTPPSRDKPAALQVVDHWTPWTDFARIGQNPESTMRPSGVSASSEALMQAGESALKNARKEVNVNDRGKLAVLVFPEMANGSIWADEDFGSAGPACIFSIGVCIASGKDGIAYPIKTANLGGTTPTDLANPKANCAKLAAPPVWLTMSPGPVDPCPTDPKTLNFFPWGDTAHLHMTPVQFFDPVLNSWVIFDWGENSQLHKWKVSSTGALTYVAESHEYASQNVREKPPGGMPGGFCSGSSNGADPNSALLFCTIPYGDANAEVVTGRFLVYDPVHLAADDSLKVLWDSQQWNIQFLFNKFNPPVVDGGQIYVPNYNGGVDLYRLTQ
jgi:hypothetical protein